MSIDRGGFKWSSFGADAALVSGGALVANVLNYVFHAVLSRRLGPDAYGSLAALLAIAMVAGVAGQSIGTVAMQETARLWALGQDASIGPFGRRMLRSAAAIAALVGFAALVLALPLSRYLHIADPIAWVALAAALGGSIVSAYARGAIQGAHRFGPFAASLIGESGIKLLLGYSLVVAGYAVGGAMAGVAAGVAVGIAIALAALFVGGTVGADAAEERENARLGTAAAWLTMIFTAQTTLLFVDTIFAKHALSGEDAGYYSAAGLIARIIPFGIGLFAPLAMPKAVAARHAGRGALAHLIAVVVVGAVASTVAVFAVFALWPDAIVTLTFGGRFAHAAPLLRLYALDTSLLALGSLGSALLAALGEYAVGAWLLAALAAEAGAMAIWGTTAVLLLEIAIAGNTLLIPPIAALVARAVAAAPAAADSAQAAGTPVAEGLEPGS